MNDWKIVKLGESIIKVSNNGLKLKQKNYLSEGKYPVIDQGQELIGGYSNDESLLVSCELPVIIFGDHTRVKKYIDFPFIIGADGTKVLKPKSFYNDKFFFYLLNSIQIQDRGYSRHFQFLEKVQIPLPPLEIQEKIAADLENKLGKLNRSVEQLKSSQAKLKLLRQSVLKKAFSPTSLIADAQEKDWKWVKLGELVYNLDGKRKPLSSKFRETFKGDYPYYGACDIIDFVKDYIFEGDYLLIGEDGANLLSRVKPLAFSVSGKFWVNNHAHIVKPKNGINLKFVEYQFNILDISKYVTGTAQPKLNQANLNKIVLKIPPLDIQDQLVAWIENKLQAIDKMEKVLSTSLKKAELLRQSILKKAFTPPNL